MQRPVRLKPIQSNNTTASVSHSSPYRLLDSSHENDQPFNCIMEKESWRRLTTVEASHGISPYCLPVINNFVTPVPPATKRKERGLKATPSSTVRGRRLRPTTASSGADDTPMLRSSVHQSRVCVNMVYFGKTVHLSHDLTDMRDEVKVFQQHCGGENLCVYKGKLREGETFQFISRRHRGFPFSLTFFLNGLQVERLSSCCEFKHRKGSRLGGRHGHFGFSSVEGASPCYKCIIAMGLDKKPTPPPKRVKAEIGREESVSSPKDAPEMETERTGDDACSHSEYETSQPQDMETSVKEETVPEEDKGRDDYEEDFEADDEGPAKEAKAEKSPSPSSEMERHYKDKDASETENDEKDGSSSSGSDQEESDAEATEDIEEDKKAAQSKEVSQDKIVVHSEEKDVPNPEEASATEGEPAVAKDSHMDSAGNSTEIEISDTSVPSGSENRQSDDVSGDKDVEKMVEESKQEEEQERAKSVQEKLAEAILKESQCSSEPELSDTSTEEEEEATHKSPEQDNKGAVPEKLVTFTEQQQTLAEETKCEESVTDEHEVAQKQEESCETKEQSDDEQEPHESSDSTKDEKVEEAEKAAEDEATAEEDKSEETGEALTPVNEENVAQDCKTADPLEEAPAETTDAEPAENNDKKEEKTEETGQGAKSKEEHESSVSGLNKKTDETAVPDNAEAEAMTTRETIEIKAESSEEREALSYEEAPVTDAEKWQQADNEDRAAVSETKVTTENSSSLLDASGGTTVEKTADTSEENPKDERIKDDIKEEQLSGEETSKGDSHHEACELDEERTEISEKIDEKEDKQKSEKNVKEEEKQTHITPDEIAKDENTEKREHVENVETEVEGNDESKADEGTDKQENTAEHTDNATETKGDEEAVKTLGEEDKVTVEGKVEESGKAEIDENSECVENKNNESEANGADKNNKGEEDEYKTNTAAQEENSEAEKSEMDNENKAEQSEAIDNQNDEAHDEKGEMTDKSEGVGQEISETTEEAEKSADVGVKEATDGPEATEDTQNMTEAQTFKEETGSPSEKGEIDAENGEISAGVESKIHEDEGEIQPKDKNDLKTKENSEEESKTEGPVEDESTGIKILAEFEVSAKKHEDDKVDQVPGADKVGSDDKDEIFSVEKYDKSIQNNSQPETAGIEIKEEPKLDDSKDGEETEQDQNGSKSGFDHENIEPDLIKKDNSIQNITDEVTVVSLGNQEQTSAPIAVDLDDATSKLDEEKEIYIYPQTDENAISADLSPADGENGADTEEASKASEEGASVLLKPQAQNNESDNAEQRGGTSKESPEALAREDSTDLVSNWVNMHQSSKFFETFVEPLEDLRVEISDAQVSNLNKEETISTKNPDEDEAQVYMDIEEVEEKTEVKSMIPRAETEQSERESATWQNMRSEEHKGSKGSMGSLTQNNEKQGNNKESTFSKTEVESISGSHHSATGKPESVSTNQTDEKTTKNDLDIKLTAKEGPQSKSPLGVTDTDETWEKAGKQSREVTDTTNFTSSKSDDGSQEESHGGEIEGKLSDRSSRDRKDLQLIEDIKHTLSKDRLSTFSVDETLFGCSSYPLLTAARAESGH